MVSLKNKVVFISGASSGIGEACAKAFAGAGANLILCARNIEKLQNIAASLKEQHHIDVLTYKLDVREKQQVNDLIDGLTGAWQKIDILVNNAGLAFGMDKLHEGNIDEWDIVIDTNIKGLLYLTRRVVPLMLSNGINGHVINLGSTAGILAYPGGSIYCATKAAVKFISDGLRMDVVDKPIRVTNIQPGMVETNFSVIRFHGDKKRADSVYEGIQALTADDIADIVLYSASVPPHVQICEVTVTPTNQATGGIVYKRPK